MGITYHADLEIAAGDDWLIAGTLLDADGQPIDLSQAGTTIEWVLFNPDGGVALTSDQFTVNVVPQEVGNISIVVPRISTYLLPAGRYTDSLRVTTTIRSVEWRGNILVSCDLFELVTGA